MWRKGAQARYHPPTTKTLPSRVTVLRTHAVVGLNVATIMVPPCVLPCDQYRCSGDGKQGSWLTAPALELRRVARKLVEIP